MIAVVDYGLGNVQAFANIYRRQGLPVTLARTPGEMQDADRLILPGVGAFDWAMRRLNASGLRDKLDEMVLDKKVKVLGVCVGMQMMARRSEEGEQQGLGWIKGEVVRFDTTRLNQKTHLPHMGWNDVSPVATDTLFRSIALPRYYFLHSYHVVPSADQSVLATTHYGTKFASAIRSDNIYGTQFHPEKSHEWGIGLLRNFAEI